ncbi:hypothetical protein GCM10010321_11500 [Streptomyces chartreusis]|nr:hypothetical protein CP983_05810 [Streptomyces chartreusis]GGW98774.1 hypothetical protein GCM10010321_11500 [Streptomyces chartreusis]
MAGGPDPYKRRNRAKRAEYAEIVFDLTLEGLSIRKIDALTQDPNGPTGGHRISATTAKEMIREEAARRIDPKVDEWRAVQVTRIEAALARLDGLEEAAHKVLEREHITVNNGRIIKLDDGVPLLDDGPVLAAIDRLVKIEEARLRNGEALRRILGLDMPVKVDATVTETTQQDLELQEMLRDAKAQMQLEEQQIIDGGDG